MVLQTERCIGGYHQENYSAHQGPNGYYSNFQEITEENNSPYFGYNQYSSFRPHATTTTTTSAYQQSGYPIATEYHHGNGGSHYQGGGFVTPIKPHTSGYGSPYYEKPFGHGSTDIHQHDYGSSHGYVSSNSHGYGNHFEKEKHGHKVFGSSGPKYGNSHSGMGHGHLKPTWTLKGLEDEE